MFYIRTIHVIFLEALPNQLLLGQNVYDFNGFQWVYMYMYNITDLKELLSFSYCFFLILFQLFCVLDSNHFKKPIMNKCQIDNPKIIYLFLFTLKRNV